MTNSEIGGKVPNSGRSFTNTYIISIKVSEHSDQRPHKIVINFPFVSFLCHITSWTFELLFFERQSVT